ncbi:MAG: type III pantothenate kinase [Candidatus Omnitrophica bacterium]|nr:type III pantothenate kinase [Candidatus Omnitrophota bacterium]MDD5653507.1 type III pantothenate kinase [Candidatus Omnitrophota bacterium]
MILAVDIGNTNITLGIFKDSRLVKRSAIPTAGENYSYQLKQVLRGYDICYTIICSVVPLTTRKLARDLKILLKNKPLYIVGKDIKVPVRNLYRSPRQVGQDRLVNAYAGVILYGAPLIVVDFGTAVTFDVISRKKEYLGGMIIPGLRISLEALNQRTALLPKIKLSQPQEFIGRDTRNSMLSGIIYGFAALTDDLASRIRKKIGRRALLVGTGGNIKLIAKYCRKIDKIDQDLTLQGLNLLARRE